MTTEYVFNPDLVVPNNVVNSWSDCVMEILGWFQISGTLNPSTNNFMPEVGSDGNPISGPGWVAYEKPGAMPGDIVIVYRLTTVLANGSIPNTNQLGSVLWNLFSPNGLTYWTYQSGLKYGISPTDLVTQFPHPGGALTPSNPDNPLGNPDILWTKVTTQYNLPGPGNTDNPQFIRQILPQFGVRALVWTDSCCIAANMTMSPPEAPTPPTDTPGDPPSTPVTDPPTIGVPGGQPDEPDDDGEGISSDPTPYQGPDGGNTVQIPTNARPTLVPGNGNRDPDPSSFPGQVNEPSVNVNAIPVGTSPVPRPYGSVRQPNFSHVPVGHPLSYVDKIGDYDLHIASRARPVGTRYLKLINGGINPIFEPKRVKWQIAPDSTTLQALGLAGHAPSTGVRGQLGSTALKTAPSGRAGQRNAPHRTEVEFEARINPSVSVDPVAPPSGGLANQKTTVGGAGTSPSRRKEDVGVMSAPRLVQAGNSQYVKPRRRGSVSAYKPQNMTNKGLVGRESSGTLDIGALRRRTLRTNIVRQATQATNTQYTEYKLRGPMLRDLKRSKQAPRLREIKDPSGQFEIRPIPFRGGENWAYVTVVCGNVQSRRDVVLNQIAYLHTNDGVMSANVGTSGVMQFGLANQQQPGMYVIANPSCIPGQDSLPNIIAGGQTWTIMSLVSALQTIEGNLIASSIQTFLPAGPGDTDVQAPNRLPVGLMRDLEITSTANFIYDGTVSEKWPISAEWFYYEPSVVMQRAGSNSSSVSLVLKVTSQSQEQNVQFRPLMELYEDTVLQSSGPLEAFVGGPCDADPGWYDPTLNTGNITGQYPGAGGIHTACPGMQGYGGAGGTSAYVVDSFGVIQSGPYNPSVYAGTHQCFLHFNYDSSQAATSDSTYIQGATNYRLRVYNNGPANNSNGYVIYSEGMQIVPATASLSILSGELQGSITTYHCNQAIKLVNTRTFEEIERRSSWDNGTITLGNNTALDSRLTVQSGDTIKVFRPGYDNQYNSQQVITEFTI